MINLKKLTILIPFPLLITAVLIACSPLSTYGASLPEPISTDKNNSKIIDRFEQKQDPIPYGKYQDQTVVYRQENIKLLPTGWYNANNYNAWRENNGSEIPKSISSDEKDSDITDHWNQPQPSIIYGKLDGKTVFYRSTNTDSLPAGWYYAEEYHNWLEIREGKPQIANQSGQLGPIPIPHPNITREQLIQNIISTLLILISLVGLIGVIWGGFIYITSAGNPDQATKGKNAILGGIIGIIITYASYAIIRLLI